ncbi:hypothetical protein [Algoriphagus resistens]|uniref:hypothetical protein n=1 Tax=Algoriphagus resistens TaxID=1750590 RepID=UPI0007168BBF|nr:hypothetical protein [Algoriphagus resistens]
MTLDQLYKLIENSTSIWDSAMITIQTVFIVVAGFLAYQQFILQKKSQTHSTAKEIVRQNLDLNEYIREILNTSPTKKIEEKEFKIKFGNLPESFARTINKIYQICDNIPEEDKLTKLFVNTEKEIDVLGNQRIWELHFDKNGAARSIQSEFLDTLAYLEILNQKAPNIPENDLIVEFNNIVTKLPRFIGDKISENMRNFVELDQEIRKELKKYL